jgi:rod shape-determining protein MreD
MSEYPEPLYLGIAKRRRFSRFRAWVLFAVPLAAILFQVYVPLFFQYGSYLDLPLIVTVYFSVTRRQPIGGILIGAGIGLVQDSLSHQPLGLFGITKTLCGYVAASLGTRFEAEHGAVRFALGFVFFVLHQLAYWFLRGVLLGQAVDPEILRTLLLALLNGAVTPPLFYLFDKLKTEG